MLADEQGGETLADGDGLVDSAGWTVAEHLHAVHDAAELADKIGDFDIHATEFSSGD